MKFIYILLTFFIAIPAFNQNSLLYKLEKGKTYRHHFRSVTNLHQVVDGKPGNTDMDLTGTVAYTVESKTGQTYRLKTQYEKLVLNMKFDGRDLTFSSEDAAAKEPTSLIMRKLIGSPFYVQINEDGKLIKVEQVDQLLESGANGLTEIPGSRRKLIADEMKNTFGERAFRRILELAFHIYPAEKGNPKTWNISYPISKGTGSMVKSTLNLVKQEGGLNIICGSGKVLPNPKKEYLESGPSKVRYDMNGTVNYTVKVHQNTGWIKEATLTQTMKGNTYVIMTGKPETKIPMDFTITITIKE